MVMLDKAPLFFKEWNYGTNSVFGNGKPGALPMQGNDSRYGETKSRWDIFLYCGNSCR